MSLISNSRKELSRGSSKATSDISMFLVLTLGKEISEGGIKVKQQLVSTSLALPTDKDELLNRKCSAALVTTAEADSPPSI